MLLSLLCQSFPVVGERTGGLGIGSSLLGLKSGASRICADKVAQLICTRYGRFVGDEVVSRELRTLHADGL